MAEFENEHRKGIIMFTRKGAYKVVEDLILLKRNITFYSEKKYLSRNRLLKNSHLGERCFVFGNGPSAKELDLSKFGDEFVFTVNQIARNPQFPALRTNVHFWADYNFFNLDLSMPENMEILDQMRGVNTEDNTPMCFFPLEFRSYIEKTQLNSCLDTFYFFPTYQFEFGQNRDASFDKSIPAFYTVVHYAIYLAVYMGFSEIYLLGCENTGILTTIKVRLQEDPSDTYGYSLTNNEKKRLINLRERVKFSDELFAFYKTTLDYELLVDYCKKHGSNLYNCTPHSLAQSVEYKDLNTIIN